MRYHLDELDLEFVMSVQDKLQQFYPETASEILVKSSFMSRLKDDPEYVYHYDEEHWALVIKKEYETKTKQYLM